MSSCVLKFTGRMDGGRFVFACENCREEVRGKRKESPPKAMCGNPGERKPRPLPILDGPGTELTAIFAELSIKPKASCGCKAKAAQMNANGIKWCKENRSALIEWLREAYREL